MARRKAHGKGAPALVRVETPPADELQPGRAPAATGPIERRSDGRFTPAGARVAGRLAGKRSAERRKLASELADQLGLAEVPEQLRPYIDYAKDFAQTQITSLTDQFGHVGPGPSSMVMSAALALAASRAAYASGKAKDGAALADKSRQTLLTAHHMAELEAKARPPEQADQWWLEGADADA